MSTSPLYIITKLGVLFIKSPISMIREFNLKNIKKLRIALKEERDTDILNNVDFFLSKKHGTNVSYQNEKIQNYLRRVQNLVNEEKKCVLFIGHEGSRTGAPLHIYHIAKYFLTNKNVHPIFL